MHGSTKVFEFTNSLGTTFDQEKCLQEHTQSKVKTNGYNLVVRNMKVLSKTLSCQKQITGKLFEFAFCFWHLSVFDEHNIASCVAESALSGPTASNSNAEKRRSEKRKKTGSRQQRIQFMVAE